jgi:hypothetical protein
MPYTLGQAAKATGKSKPAILDAIRAGRLSAIRGERNQWQIDPAELHRVYAPAVQVNDTEHKETPLNGSENALLRQQNEHLKTQLVTLEAVAADLRKDRDDLSRKLDAEAEERHVAAAEIRRLTLMITHQPANQNPPPRQEAPAKRRAWPVLVALLALAGGMAGGVYLMSQYGLLPLR